MTNATLEHDNLHDLPPEPLSPTQMPHEFETTQADLNEQAQHNRPFDTAPSDWDNMDPRAQNAAAMDLKYGKGQWTIDAPTRPSPYAANERMRLGSVPPRETGRFVIKHAGIQDPRQAYRK